MSAGARVLVAGGGIAGLEALLALRDLAGERVELTLAAPGPDFTYRPLLVEEPFTPTPAQRRELAPIAAEIGARFVQQGIEKMRPEDHAAVTADGSELAYEHAVVCVGARPRPAYARAFTPWPRDEPMEIDAQLRAAAEHPSGRIAFIVPGGVSWPLPAYELALMATRRVEDLGLEVERLVVTPESEPLIMFGPVASEAVAALLAARGIEVQASSTVNEDGGGFSITPGHTRLECGAAIALPVLEGPAIPGLPFDDDGFLPIDDHARVLGAEGVYAAGDGTNFPIKQGGIGTQQADAAAEQIAAAVGAPVDPQPFHPILRGKLITGEETLSLRADVTGGHGEGIASADYLWWPPHKVSGRYLAPWLAGTTPHADPEPPGHSIDVEVALPREWHRDPVAIDPLAPPTVD